MPLPAVGEMTMDALRAEFVSLAQQLVPLANRRAEIDREMKARAVSAKAVSRLTGMSDKEKDALREALAAER